MLRTRSASAVASVAIPRSGLAQATTRCPSLSSGSTMPSQLDESANAPWARMMVVFTSVPPRGWFVAVPEVPSGRCEGRDRFSRLDDVGREHPARLRTEVERVVGSPRRDEEALARMQEELGPPGDLHPDRPGDDVADLLAGMLMPPRLDSGGYLGERLHDLPPGDGGRDVLDLRAGEPAREVVARLGGGGGVGGHVSFHRHFLRTSGPQAAAPTREVSRRKASSSRLTSSACETHMTWGPPSIST